MSSQLNFPVENPNTNGVTTPPVEKWPRPLVLFFVAELFQFLAQGHPIFPIAQSFNVFFGCKCLLEANTVFGKCWREQRTPFAHLLANRRIPTREFLKQFRRPEFLEPKLDLSSLGFLPVLKIVRLQQPPNHWPVLIPLGLFSLHQIG